MGAYTRALGVVLALAQRLRMALAVLGAGLVVTSMAWAQAESDPYVSTLRATLSP